MQQTVMESRACRKCGYDLIGLAVGGLCPECGEPIRARRAARGPREGSMTDAPPAYVNRMIAGFAVTSVGVLGGLAGLVFALFNPWLAGGTLVLGSWAWAWGIWMVSGPRPKDFAELGNPILDNPRTRTAVRAAAAMWPLFVLLVIAASAASGVAMLHPVLRVLAGVGGLAAFAGLVPISVFIAEIEFWMSDDTGGWQLRGAAWAMTIFGVLAIVLGMIAPFFGVWATVVVLVAAAVLLKHVVGCVSQARWVRRYQEQNEGRAERITQRLRDRAERGGTIAGNTPCLGCGYDLRGLPYGGRCPECGQSYADLTPFPVLPVPVRDETPIEVDEGGEPLEIRPAVQHVRNRHATRDDTPIPLAEGDDGLAPPGADAPARLKPDPRPAPPDADDAIPLVGDDGPA